MVFDPAEASECVADLSNSAIPRFRNYTITMYHYDINTALEELKEDAVLPNPVPVRDMLLRAKLSPDRSLELNRLFVEYQRLFGELQKVGKELLTHLAGE